MKKDMLLTIMTVLQLSTFLSFVGGCPQLFWHPVLSVVVFFLLEVIPTADPNVAFEDIDAAILVGAMPRKQGMERKDLLKANAKIFVVQGKALDEKAKKTVKVCLN